MGESRPSSSTPEVHSLYSNFRVVFFQDTFNSSIYQRSYINAHAGVVLCWLYRPSPRDAKSKPGCQTVLQYNATSQLATFGQILLTYFNFMHLPSGGGDA